MRRPIRLRWRLVASHAALALVLVLFAGSQIEQKSRVANRAEAKIHGVETDTIASRHVPPVYSKSPVPSPILIDDENQASRQAAVVAPDSSILAGPALTTHRQVQALRRILRLGDPTTTGVIDGSIVAAFPVVVDDVIVAVALESEVVPTPVHRCRRPGHLGIGEVSRSFWLPPYWDGFWPGASAPDRCTHRAGTRTLLSDRTTSTYPKALCPRWRPWPRRSPALR